MTDKELIQAVAERVMWPKQIMTWLSRPGEWVCLVDRYYTEKTFNPIINDNQLMMVLNQCIKNQYLPELKYKENGRWVCILWPGEYYNDETRPVDGHDLSINRAVCLASLKMEKNS